MPALPAVANVLKVAYTGTLGAFNWAVINHCSWSGTTPTVAILDTLAGDLEAIWAAHMIAHFNAPVVLTKVTLTDLTSSSGAQGNWSGTEAGTRGGSTTPANAAVLINYPSSFRYRGGHPRTYLPPGDAADLVDTSHWTTAYQAGVVASWTDLTAGYYGTSSGGTTLGGQCAVSYVYTPVGGSPGTRRTTPVVMPIAQNTFNVIQQVASQRRRIGRK